MSGVELDCTLGRVDVENVVLRLPAHGGWDATMDIGRPDAPPERSAATLRIARTTGVIDTFTGVVRRASVTPGTQNLSVTIVGGSGRNLDVISARHHTAGAATVPAGLVLRGIADAASYTLAAGVEAAIDAYPLHRYTRVQSEAWQALNVLAAVLSTPERPVGWRVLADGTLWMGVETWLPAVDARSAFWRGDPRDGAVWYAPTDGAPYRPGTTIDGARVVECCYAIKPGQPAMKARVAVPGDPVIVPPLAPYARTYACTVVSQNGDYTLNLGAGGPVLGDDLRNVPFKLGIPGTRVTVPTGAIVRVAFEGGLPTGIYAGDIDLNSNASKRFSLLDDNVDCGTITVVAPAGGGPCTVTTNGGSGTGPQPISGTVTGPGHLYAYGIPAPS